MGEEQDLGVTASPSGCQPPASAASADAPPSSQSGIPNAGLTAADLVPGGWYRGKLVRRVGWDDNNDRRIIWMSRIDAGEHRELQYDSATVGFGRNYPKTTVGKFLRWARRRINADGTPYAASGIEAATAGETRSGSTEGESQVPKADAKGKRP